MSDPLQALLKLCDAPGRAHRRAQLIERFGGTAECLITSGALVRCANLASIFCYECEEGHPARIERDGGTGQHWYFCPEAGRVEVDDADPIAFRFDIDWLLEQLAKAVPTLSFRPTTLIEDRAWFIGLAITGRTEWNAIFTRRILGLNHLDELSANLRSLPPAEVSLALTTTPAHPHNIPLPAHSTFVDLTDVASWQHGAIVLDQGRLRAWLRAAKDRRPAAGSYGSFAKQVEEIERARADRGVARQAVHADAKAFLDEWADHFPDAKPPGLSTVRRHLTTLRQK